MENPRELIYAYDPLSAWCYAYRPEITRIEAALKGELPLRIVCAGLAVGERERPIREDKDRLELEMGEVLRRSGIGFGRGFVKGLLEEGSWVRRSEPACRAVLIAQDLHRDCAVEFANRICHAHFWTGLKIDEPETLARIAATVQVDAEALLERWRRPGAADATYRAFAAARWRGVETYPCLFLNDGGERYRLVCRGYVRANEAIPRIREAAGLRPAR